METMTALTDLRTKLRDEYLGIDPNGKIWSNTVVDAALNRGYFQLQKDGQFKWRENIENSTTSTVAGQQEYDMPSDFMTLRLIRYNNQYLVKNDKIKLKQQNQQSPMPSGTPSEYYLYDGNIGLYPIPNSTGTLDLEYVKRLPTITTSQDSLFPVDFDDAICAYAKYVLYNRNNKQEAVQSLGDYNLLLDTLVSSYIYQDSFGTKFRYQRGGYTTQPNVYDRHN